MFFDRILDLKQLLDKKSHFLIGPRSTGKSSWIKKSLPDCLYFNLLEQDLLRELLVRPSTLRRGFRPKIPPEKLLLLMRFKKFPLCWMKFTLS